MMNGDSLSLKISRNHIPRNIECAHSMVPRCANPLAKAMTMISWGCLRLWDGISN